MLDLGKPKHGLALLQWLNKWGCRINRKSFDNIGERLAEWFPEVANSRMIPQAIESQALTLTELLDQYHWVTITRRHKVPTSGGLARWTEWASCETAR